MTFVIVARKSAKRSMARYVREEEILDGTMARKVYYLKFEDGVLLLCRLIGNENEGMLYMNSILHLTIRRSYRTG